jgi:hypothetical protein
MRQWERWGITDIFLAAKDYLCFYWSVNNQGTNFTESTAFSTPPLQFAVVFPTGGPTCQRSQKWCLVGLRWGFCKFFVHVTCTGTTWMLTNTDRIIRKFEKKKAPWGLCFIHDIVTENYGKRFGVSDAVFTSLKQNWMQGCCSFKSATTKSRFSLNMHTNKHPSRSEGKGYGSKTH